MTIIHKPDSLSLSYNIRDFKIASSESVSFVLMKGVEELISQTYEPGQDGYVTINIRDIVHAQLSFILQDIGTVYEQPSIVGDFTAIINGTEVSFRVIRSGVDRLADSATNFLTGNFLTWQPSVKSVTYYSPEFLTYYSVTESVVKLRAYFTGESGNITEQMDIDIASLSAGKAYTIPLQYAVIAGLLNNKLPAYYDVWINNSSGERLTYIQRYYASDMHSEQEQWILFENSLGGIDTFRAYGSTNFTGEHTHNIAEIDETASEYRVDTERKFQKNTGHLDKYERKWLLDFFPSKAKYIYAGNYLRAIVVVESNSNYTDRELPSNYSFTYKYADALPLLNLARTDVPADTLNIYVPDVGSFTVPPRLAEFPHLPLTEGALFPIQSPYSEEWGTTTINALAAAIANVLAFQAGSGGNVGHTHSNFDLLQQLSYLNDYLLLNGNKIKAGYADEIGDIDKFKKLFLCKDKDDTTPFHLTAEGGITAKTPKSISQLRTLISEALTEDGESSELIMSTNAVETTDDEDYSSEVETLAAGITEESSATGGGASTLGGLDNVDDMTDDEATEDVALVKLKGTDTWIEKKLTELPGGGSASVQVRLTFISDGVQTVSYGSKHVLKYNFSSLLDGESTGAGTVAYTANGKRVAAGTIQQGENSFEVTSYLALGTNSIIVEVTDSYGTVRKLIYTIETVDISITSTFDESQIFNGAISFKYTPVGAVEKTIRFKIDGIEVATYATTVTNRQQTQALPAQAHGAHTLEVYMTAELSGSTVESNHLYYALACIVAGNMTPVVAISYNATEAEQYSTIVVPYLVYDPAKSIAGVSLSVNGTVVSTLQVGRTRQTWNYRVNKQGELILSVTCGATTASKTIEVNKSAIDVEAETADLELYLTSMGRSNSETNKSEWKYDNIASVMTGFNWATNGWIADANGNVALRVQGDARVNIPLQVFAQDIRQNGKTIEFEFSTKNVVDYDTPLISCWNNGKGFKITAQEAIFVSTQSSVSARFKEEERVRISFVVSELAENRLIHTYINGVASGSIQYPTTDSFAQVNPADITIGSNDATIDIYNIRVYGNNLNRYQLLDNYIADMDDVDKKLSLYNRNQIYDDYGNIDLNKINRQLAIMYIIGDLPAYKGDKKTVSVEYVDLQNPELSFTATKVKIDVQGTSSQYYPRKNYKLTFANGFEMTYAGAHADLYAITPGEMLPSKVFCTKADFAESSGTHNTGLANYVDWLLKQMGILTVPQLSDAMIRTTVYGKPMVIAHKATADGNAEFIGKYNFNTDKGAEQSFGFSEGDESWETLNNTSDRTNFRTSEYNNMTDDAADWTGDFAARYPDDDAANAEYEAGTRKPENLKRITDWIVSCGTDSARFKAEISNYMDKQQLIAYWIITLVFGMVDQRAKNMFLTYYHGGLWLFIFYDNDTCLGINNEGAIEFLYNIEVHDIIGSQNVWNGAESALWNLVEAAFASEIKAMYTTMRQQGYLTYDKVMEYLNTSQSAKWCEAIYNEDGYFKYEKPLVDGYLDYSVSHENPTLVKTGAYLYAMQGSREMHRKWWFYYRLLYLDSKYLVASVLADTAVFRTYTPAQWAGVAPKADLTLTAFNAMYFNVKWGSVSKSARAGEKETVILTAPDGMQFNDTETIIYGSSMILSLGDLSPLYVGTVDVSKMKRLRELIIGSSVEGYSNTNLRTLSVGNNLMLLLINIRNCPGYTQTLDLSGCENIESILAAGSGITGVSLPTGGNLKTLELPASIKSLTIKNQPLLQESGFTIEGVANLTTLVLENTNIDTFALLARCFSESVYALERVRLIDVQGTTNSTAQLAKLVNMGGVDENGNDIGSAVVTGECDVVGVYRDDLNVINATFPELVIKYQFVWIRFLDPVFQALCANVWDSNGDGEISEEEAAVSGNVSKTFQNKTEITDATPFKYLKAVADNKDYSTFIGCTSLKKAAISGGQFFTGNMFRGCISLEEVELPSSASNLYYNETDSMFSGCSNLKTVKLPTDLKSASGNMFYQCTSLLELDLPETITYIGGGCTNGCTNLKRIINRALNVPVYTGNYAFANCPNLETMIILQTTPPSLGYGSFDGTDNCKFYVPDASLNAYKTASGWSGIASRIYALSTYTETY